ncbi:MAG TPA: hypothetical protein PLI57_08970 [Spirochaetota bacterium]|nr:hypothetical protein [Spirochaetota bacterium]
MLATHIICVEILSGSGAAHIAPYVSIFFNAYASNFYATIVARSLIDAPYMR